MTDPRYIAYEPNPRELARELGALEDVFVVITRGGTMALAESPSDLKTVLQQLGARVRRISRFDYDDRAGAVKMMTGFPLDWLITPGGKNA